MLDVAPRTSTTTNDLTLSSTAIESVDLGDCTSAALHTSVAHAGLQPLSGPLELHSSINSVASTTTCNITLYSEVAAAIKTQYFYCSERSELFLSL